MKKLHKFKNGAVLLYQKNNMNKGTDVKIGICNGGEADKNTGISHFVEHMLFKGTKNKSKEELNEDIRNNISTLNASTYSNCMLIRFYENSKRLEKDLEIGSDLLLNSTFPVDEIEKEKSVVLQEILIDKDNEANWAYRNLMSLAYICPETKSTILGDEEKLKNLTQKDLFKYQKKNFVAENFLASVSSNLSFSKIKKLIKVNFIDKLSENPDYEKQEYYEKTLNGKSAIKFHLMDRNKINMLIAFPACGFLELQTSFLKRVLCKYLNVIKSPMYEIFRETNQLVYSVNAVCSTLRNNGLFYFNIKTSKENVNKCIDVLANLIDLLKQGISENDVKRLQRNYKDDMALSLDLPGDMSINNWFDYLGYNKLLQEKDFKFEKKAITKENLDKVISDIFNFDKVFVSVAGNINKKDVYSINKIIDVLKGK